MRPTLPLLLTLVLPSLPGPASADSPASWAAFRDRVQVACAETLAAIGWPVADAIDVNPFGSQSYGVALVDAGGDRLACIYDKVTGVAEITGPFAPAESADAP